MNHKDKKWRWLSVLVSVVLFGLVVMVLLRSDITAEIRLNKIDWVSATFLLITRALFFVPTGIMLALFTKRLGAPLRFYEWFGLSVVSTFSNLIVPGGAAVTRASYLKRRYDFPITQFSALMAATYLIMFSTYGFTGLFLMGGYFVIEGNFYLSVTLLMLGMGLGPLIIVLLPSEQLAFAEDNRLMRIIRSALIGWQTLRKDRFLLLKQSGISLFNLLLQALSLYLAWRTIGFEFRFVDSLFVGILTMLTNIIRITPGALGIAEAIGGVAAEFVGIGTARGISAVFLTRIASLIVVLILGPIFSYKLTGSLLGKT